MDIAETLKLQLRQRSSRRTISWGDLPGELLVSITKLLDDEHDSVIRMRAVCSSWRSSTSPPPKKPHLQLIFPIYNTSSVVADHSLGYFKISARTIYHLKLAPTSENLIFQHCSSEPSLRRNGWLVRVQETQTGEFTVLNPFGGRIDSFPPHAKLNSLDFHKSEIAKGYNLHFVNTAKNNPCCTVQIKSLNNICQSSRVCLSSKPVSTADDYAAMALNDCNGILHQISGQQGDDQWRTRKRIVYRGRSRNIFARDILEYEGHFYVVVHKWNIVKFDYSFQVVGAKITPHCSFPCTPHLVECKGNLLLVYKCCYNINNISATDFKIKVFKLDDDQLLNWREVNDLGDSVLFICHDCSFSVSAHDFPGLKGNCVYFMQNLHSEFSNNATICKGMKGFPIYVFNLEDGTVKPLVSHSDNSSILWTIPCDVCLIYKCNLDAQYLGVCKH